MAIKSHFEQPKRLGHVMLDLETMGNRSNSAIVSIGAVEFDINTGELGREFYRKIDLKSCLDKGMKINADTLNWWLMQNESARKMVAEGQGSELSHALYEFKLFLTLLDVNKVKVWGNSVRFDCGILQDAYTACNESEPWNFRNEMDVRTLVAFAPEVKANFPSVGILHDPIADCKFQIGYCTAIWQKINNLTTITNISGK